MDEDALKKIENDAIEYCHKMVAEAKAMRSDSDRHRYQWDLYSVIVSCGDGRNIRRGHNQKRKEKDFEQPLRDRLKKLGNIGDRPRDADGKVRTDACGNVCHLIGSCAEPNAANKLLKINPKFSLKKIEFSKAYRPRCVYKDDYTPIAYCQNCIDTFETIKNKTNNP